MKKILTFILACFMATTIFAAPIKKLIFFGDSLTDDGNLYRLLFKIIPKSPPYFQGRFSNGPTWAEHLGKYYYDQYYADYKIYAYGGATAIFHQATGKFLAPTLLEIELYRYLLDALFQDKNEALFSIWIGGNDYLFDETTDIDVATSKVVDKIEWAIRKLISYGGEKFLLFNLPDLSRIPFSNFNNTKERLHALSIVNNLKLAQAVDSVRRDFPDIKIVFMNIFDTFQALMANPDEFNEKYKIHIKNITDACWSGGFVFAKNLHLNLNEEVRADLKNTDIKKIDAKALAKFISHSPSLSYTYQLGKGIFGGFPCMNADDYLFWDAIHPTQVVHNVLAQLVIEQLNFVFPNANH